MVKNKSSTASKSSKILISIFKTFEFVIVCALAAILFFVWYKPEIIIQQIKLPVQSITHNNINESINTQIANIKNDINNLSKTILSEQEKFNLLQKNIDSFNSSKIDANEIIAINNQLRNLENKTQNLAKTSNNGALLLTSAMLIKDTISRGQTCKTEAEALKILAENINSITEDVDFIYSHSSIVILSDKSIIDRFNKIYANATQPNYEKDWKKRITSKLNEYIKISTPKDKNDAQLYDKTEFLEKIKPFVDNYDFSSAIKEIEKHEEILKYSDLNSWYLQIKNQLLYYKSLSNIIATSLQIMKIENVKNNIEENSTELE